jgi:hypothetical protein
VVQAPPVVCLTRAIFALVPRRVQGPKPHRNNPPPAVRKDQGSVRVRRRHAQWPSAPIVPSNVTIDNSHGSREAIAPSMPHCGLRSGKASMSMRQAPCVQSAATVFCLFLHTRQSVRPMGHPRHQVYLIPLHYLL